MGKRVDKQKYFDYLKSDLWNFKAAQRLKIDNYKCNQCGTIGEKGNPIRVYHRFQESIGHEDAKYDLVCRCRKCHLKTNPWDKALWE